MPKLQFRRSSQSQKLWSFINNIPKGKRITMGEMTAAVRASEQAVRNYLTQVRHGRVPHPDSRNSYLPAIAVSYDPTQHGYFVMNKLIGANVKDKVPENVFKKLVENLRTRARFLGRGFIPGVAESAEKLLTDSEVRKLLQQVDEKYLWDRLSEVNLLLRAHAELRTKQLLRLESGEADKQK